MREIKFRYWHAMGKRLVPWGVMKLYPFQTLLDNPYIALMQYTGLKDKDGKEIYEGDILKDDERVGYIDPEMDWNCSCCNGVFGWVVKKISGYPDIRNIERMEIIGNIYENPELLKAAP